MASNLKYIDLYAGCGGLSWGLMRAGWKGIFAIEKDALAFSTLQCNLIDRKKHFEWPAWFPIGAHDINEVLSKYKSNPTTNRVFEQHAQRLISDAVKATLERFVTGRATLDEAVEFLRFWICQNAVRFVREFKSVKQRREIAALLLKMKDGVCYHGERGIRFVK